MDGVLEKITLYDILGYLVPGSLLMMLILVGGIGREKMLSYLESWGDYKGVLYFAFLLLSYLVGIVLSEVMAWFWKWKLFKVLVQKIRKSLRKENKIFEMIPTEQIVIALENSGISEDRVSLKSQVENSFMERYFSYVYGIIQKCDDCKRIHNYASAYVLYKNVAGALMCGGIVVLINNIENGWIGILCIVMSVVFVIRGVEFQDKKNGYAIIWFVEKFTSKIDKSAP